MKPADTNPTGTDMVVRRGKLFEVGEFKDKNFSMSSDELRSAVDRFSGPLPIDLEHVPTVLDGKLGRVDSVWLSDDGRELHGSVSIPAWLDGLLVDGERKVSATWNRATKGLEKLALVRSPRVKDAVLFAAFSEAHPDEAEVLFATPRKHHPDMTQAWQQVHDTCAMVPGVCPANPAKSAWMGDMTEQYRHLKSAHDNSKKHGAACSGRAMMNDTQPRSNPMPKIDAAAVEAPEVTDEEVNTFVHEHPDVVALKAELAAEKKKNADTQAKFAEEAETARVKARDESAKIFANEEIDKARSLTAMFDDLVDQYVEAAELDHKSGEVVTFSDATGAKVTGSRVDKLKAREARRPAHSLFDPALGDGVLLNDGEKVLFNGKANNTAESDRAAADAVLEKTNDGRAILARRKAGK